MLSCLIFHNLFQFRLLVKPLFGEDRFPCLPVILLFSLLIIFSALLCEYESVVSTVSKRYMRAGIGNDRLLVCLSEYLP